MLLFRLTICNKTIVFEGLFNTFYHKTQDKYYNMLAT